MIPESKSEWFRFYYAFFVSNFKTKSMAWRQVAAKIDWLFVVLRPAQEFFTYMETSPLPVKGCKI